MFALPKLDVVASNFTCGCALKIKIKNHHGLDQDCGHVFLATLLHIVIVHECVFVLHILICTSASRDL